MIGTLGRDRIGSIAMRSLLSAVFVLASGMKLAAVPFEVAGFTRFGYTMWFMYAIGMLQLVGAIMLWTRGLVGYGSILLAVLMLGAIGSHLHAGDPAFMPVPAFALFVLLTGLAYARRAEVLPIARLRVGSLAVLIALVGGNFVFAGLLPLLAAAAEC